MSKKEVGSGFVVDLNPSFVEHHRQYSKIMLRTIWSNLDGLFYGPPTRTIVFKDWGALTIFRMKGTAWIHLLLLPLSLTHESLHFLIGMITSNKYLITLIPPLIDLAYLPLAFLLLIWTHANLFVIPLAFWFEFCWLMFLMGNLSGDFTILRSSKIEESDNPHNDQP